MDRQEPGLIKWSPNAAHDSFLHISLQERVVQLYEPTGLAQRGRFEYRKLAKHNDLPPLTAYDWSPTVPGIVAVGTQTGVVNLLRIDDNSNGYQELALKISRTCQAVAFNTGGKLAVALDRVRSDHCLYIWDVSRLSSLNDAHIVGLPPDLGLPLDPVDRLEHNASVSSIRFFEDNPNVLVAGIKGQGLRIHDLRDHAHSSVAYFQTKCCNNLAIDYADQNYFASSALDQPGVMIWDRRALNRHTVSSSYAEALDRDGLCWGGALRLDRAVHVDPNDPAALDAKSSMIRSLRFCRDHPGMLAVLSQTGQLRVFSARHEHLDPDARVASSPELLEVRRSYEMDPLYAEPGRKSERIVSFDWITMSSPVLKPRVLVLRANGTFDVLEKPSFTSEYPFKLVPWQPPYRGLDGTDYQELMEFEPSQEERIFAPFLTEQALTDVPLFGPNKASVRTLVEKTLADGLSQHTLAVSGGSDQRTSVSKEAPTVADKLKALRKAAKNSEGNSEGLLSQLERRESLLSCTRDMTGLSSQDRYVLDHVMLLRAQEGYRFDPIKNQGIVADDPWLKDAWAWVAGAEAAAFDDGMVAFPLDVGYMGVHTIWNNDLGSRPEMRLAEDAELPDEAGWERCLNTINKQLRIPKFDGQVKTRRPHHRAMCLAICGFGRSDTEDMEFSSPSKRESTWYTMVAAQALFRGDTKGAVQVLKKASTEYPELLFVSLALQLMGKNGGHDGETNVALDFDEKVASRTDPYLRAISAIIATGDWAVIANQRSLPLRDRCFVAVRNLDDDALTAWLDREVSLAIETGDIEGIVLTGITDRLVDILARYVHKFNDFQTATLLLSICAPRFIDDIRATAFRNAYRNYLQRHRAFFLRAKFDVESTKRSKHRGVPTLRPAARQIGLRCVYCDVAIKQEQLANTSVSTLPFRASTGSSGITATNPATQNSPNPSGSLSNPATPRLLPGGSAAASRAGTPSSRSEFRYHQQQQAAGSAYTDKLVSAGISCPNCKQHLPRCVVCLEVVGIPRTNNADLSQSRGGEETRRTARFPTFCVACGHVLHLDHARQWFARHRECPVPECRCLCNTRVNEELDYA